MLKRKRKHGDSTFAWSAGMTMLAVGFCALVVISVGAMWQWATEERGIASPYRTYQNNFTPQSTIQRALGPLATATQRPDLSKVLPEGSRMYLSTASGDIVANDANGKAFLATGLHGGEVAVAPDGRTLAYSRGGKLYIYQGTEKEVPISGNILMPSWSVDGETLAFVVREAAGDTIYRLAVSNLQPERLLTVPEIVAPPLTNPATGRLLVAEKLGTRLTVFYSIDPNCATQGACQKSRRDIATIKYAVNWADYHPNAGSIVFSDGDDGNIYLMKTGSGDVISLVATGGYKRRPVFNKDMTNGTWLAYTNVSEGNRLVVYHLDNRMEQEAAFTNVASLGWAD